MWKVEQALRWIFEDSTEIAKVSNSLVPDHKKRPERGVSIEALAETKGDSVVEEKPVDPNGYKGFKGVHVVKTCGEMHKSRHN